MQVQSMEIIGNYTYTEILQRLQSGDETAFTLIYNHFWDKLYISALTRLRDEFLAEEVVQMVFLRLWQKRENIEIQNLPAYLAAMTRYGVYELMAQATKKEEKEQFWSIHRRQSTSHDLEIEQKFMLHFIRELTHELPEKCRLVFIYNKLEDQSIADVAARMNISRKTAEAHLTKALRFIRLKVSNFLNLLILLTLWV